MTTNHETDCIVCNEPFENQGYFGMICDRCGDAWANKADQLLDEQKEQDYDLDPA